MTNAGRSHEAQTFTYLPDIGIGHENVILIVMQVKCIEFHSQHDIVFLTSAEKNVQPVKTEAPSAVKPCMFEGHLKAMSPEQSDCLSQSSKRQEDTPMEVSSNPPVTVFKVNVYSLHRVE